jgi:rhodanese-related sulfurtransferase
MTIPSPATPEVYAEPALSAAHFAGRLAVETDCADVAAALARGGADFVLVDCRSRANYEKNHLPGAVSLPWSEITAERVAEMGDVLDGPIVTYCWGPACNAATRGAARLAALGKPVKEMIGGLEYWIREGHPTEGRRPGSPSAAGPGDRGLFA